MACRCVQSSLQPLNWSSNLKSRRTLRDTDDQPGTIFRFHKSHIFSRWCAYRNGRRDQTELGGILVSPSHLECPSSFRLLTSTFFRSIHGFRSIGYVQLFPSPPSSSSHSATTRQTRRGTKNEKNANTTTSAWSSYVAAIVITSLVLVAAFSVPYFSSPPPPSK